MRHYGAFPLRKVDGGRRSEKTVNDHLALLKRHLWDEGPQTTDQLCALLNLSENRVVEILGMGIHEGTFQKIRRSNSSYWMIHESINELDEVS
jgi:hypothetical protein